MLSQRYLILSFVFAAAILVLAAIMPLHTARTVRSMQQEVQRAEERGALLTEVLSLIQDAETGQRGFIITGREDFLEPYQHALAGLQRIRPLLTRQQTRFPESGEPLQKLDRAMDAKLRELAETINLRRAGGFRAAEPIVTAASGKQYMDQIRESIRQLAQLETARRAALDVELEQRIGTNAYTGLIVTVLDVAVLSLLAYLLARLVADRQRANDALRESQASLNLSVAELERRNAEISLMGEMTRALDVPVASRELFEVIGAYGARLMPNISGALYWYRNSRDVLELETGWGAQQRAAAKSITPDECWALRRGQPHRSYEAPGLICPHAKAEGNGGEAGRLCIPLIAQGEVLGLLSMERDADGKAAGALDPDQEHVAMLIAEQMSLSLSNMRLRETLQHQSIVDPLTGLFNRRYMDETLRRELSRAEREALPLSIIVLDVDHFKRINDEFGHDAGDAVLRSLGTEIKRYVRDSDVACRFGGEEFVLLLPGCNKHTTAQRSNVLLNTIRAMDVPRASQSIGPITASLGVATFPEDGNEPDALIQVADRAMYTAKRSGRNRVVVAGATGAGSESVSGRAR
jgi:diguanylate cyclase (GGDEF)-like protein